jgi:CO/xanthine dehydrogenase Mo-binding subunit
MFAAGNATLLAARAIAEQIKDEASRLLEVDPADLVLREGRVEVTGAPDTGMSLGEVSASAHMHSGPVVATGRYRAQFAPVEGSNLQDARFLRLGEPTFHCHGVEIAVDEETGRVDVLNFVAVHDVGTVVNPVGARGQVEGGVVQGIGYALTENLKTSDAGVILNGNFHDYRLPTIADVPPSIETVFIETNHSNSGPFGAKGLGEPPVILPAAAIGSALRDLLGVQPYHLPLDADRVVVTLAERDDQPVQGHPAFGRAATPDGA